MRREDLTVTIEDGTPPTLRVTCAGAAESLRARLDDDGEARDATDLDVAYRRTPDEADHDGVVGVTDRMTGAFVFEATAEADAIATLVTQATATDRDDPHYRLRIEPGDEDPLTAEKRTLLVYDSNGSLDRSASLIPGSVEL